MVLRGSPTFPFILGRGPFSLRPNSPREVDGLGNRISGTSEEAQVDISSTQREDVGISSRSSIVDSTNNNRSLHGEQLKKASKIVTVHSWRDRANGGHDC